MKLRVSKYSLFLTSIILLLLSSVSFGQSISNVRATVDGDNVNVTYDLSGDSESRFNVTLYSSVDGFSSPLLQVSGDIGPDQTPGFGKRVVWRAKSELGSYVGDITFEVRALATFVPLKLTRPAAGTTVKPGGSLPIRWEGGESGANMKLELMQNNTLERDIGTTSNTGSYTWTVPSSISPGAGYKVRIYDTSNAAGAVESGSFSFKAKSKGMWWKIGVPVVVVGAVVGIIAASGNGNGGGNNDLPTPPDPPSDGSISLLHDQYNNQFLIFSNR